MTIVQSAQYKELETKLGTNLCREEWAYFQEYARYFKSNPKEQAYGILIMGSKPSEDNMIYSSDIGDLRIKHLRALTQWGTGSPGHQQRKFLNWLEKMEGKA